MRKKENKTVRRTEDEWSQEQHRMQEERREGRREKDSIENKG